MLGSNQLDGSSKAVAFWIIFAIGAGFFFYNFTFFKFCTDEPYQLIVGDITRDQSFLIGHGESSATTGIVGGAFFHYVIGAVTWFSNDPRQVMLFFALLNIAGVFAVTAYMFRSLPIAFAIIAGLIMAVTPGVVFNANRIWCASPMFPLVALLHASYYSYFKSGDGRFFVAACALSVTAFLFHMSGVFLFPALVIIAFLYRHQLGRRWIGISLLIAFVLCGPYLYFFVFGGGFEKIIDYIGVLSGAADSKPGVVRPDYFSRYVVYPISNIFEMTLGAATIGYFKYIFGLKEFIPMMRWYAGPLYAPLYWLSMVVGVSFFAGWISYLFWAVRNRKIISTPADDNQRYPLAFQIAGFIFSSVIAVFILFRLAPWPHYYQILYPCFAIMSAWPVYRLWRFIPVRIFFGVVLSSHIILSTILWSGIKASGGASSYRISYEMQEKIKSDVWKVTPDGKTPRIYLHSSIYSLAAVYSMVGWENAIGDTKKEPVAVTTGWDGYNKKVIYSVQNIRKKIDRRITLIKEGARLIPRGASVLAHDSFSKDIARLWLEFDNSMPTTDSSLIKSWINATPLGARPEENATPYTILKNRGKVGMFDGPNFPVDAGLAEYVFLNISDPRKLNPVRNMRDKKALRYMLHNHKYGLLHHREGIFIFKKGLAKTEDANFYRGYIFEYEASESQRQVGKNVLLAVNPRVSIRVADGETGKPGFLAFGPYLALPGGNYEAGFEILIEGKNIKPPLRLDVSGAKGGQILAQKEADFTGKKEWQTVTLPFAVEKSGMNDIEFRAFYNGKGSVAIGKIKLKISDRKIEEYIGRLKHIPPPPRP